MIEQEWRMWIKKDPELFYDDDEEITQYPLGREILYKNFAPMCHQTFIAIYYLNEINIYCDRKAF